MKYVVIGASAAGINGVKRLRELDKTAEITLISKDEHVYSRCIMHHYMENIRTVEQLSFIKPGFMEENNINWMKGQLATKVDLENKTVHTSAGEVVAFDKLLIAAGSHVFFPPIPGLKEAKNAIGFHDLHECEAILERLNTCENIVIMGGGLVGIDALSGLLHKGKNLSLVEMRDRMLSIQLDHRAAKTYEDAFAKEGVNFFLDMGVQSLNMNEANDEIVSITLSTGETIPCDLLVVASGVRANVGFLQDSGLEMDRFGLIIDPSGKTSHPDVYAAGDITGRNPIWPVAVKEGIIAASNMCGVAKEMTDFFASKSTMNFLDIPTMSLGLAQPEDPENYIIEIEEDDKGNYKKIVHKDGKICGAILQGDLSYSGILTQLIREKIDVSKVKKPLFKIDYSDFFNIKENFEFTYED